jgi:NAD(P)-dependent dehydrogenase (short-subunit alcohol dehydrogenase family)
VTVNAVCPGFTDTDLVARSVNEIVRKTGRDPAEARAELEASNPQGRLVTPDEVAAAVLFLCGPRAGAITGAALPVSGGEV